MNLHYQIKKFHIPYAYIITQAFLFMSTNRLYFSDNLNCTNSCI